MVFFLPFGFIYMLILFKNVMPGEWIKSPNHVKSMLKTVGLVWFGSVDSSCRGNAISLDLDTVNAIGEDGHPVFFEDDELVELVDYEFHCPGRTYCSIPVPEFVSFSFKEGWEAYMAGYEQRFNPYVSDTFEKTWDTGWLAAQKCFNEIEE